MALIKCNQALQNYSLAYCNKQLIKFLKKNFHFIYRLRYYTKPRKKVFFHLII